MKRARLPGSAGDEGVEEIGAPSKIRTYDPLIKSQLLYQLSYRRAGVGGGGTYARLFTKQGPYLSLAAPGPRAPAGIDPWGGGGKVRFTLLVIITGSSPRVKRDVKGAHARVRA